MAGTATAQQQQPMVVWRKRHEKLRKVGLLSTMSTSKPSTPGGGARKSATGGKGSAGRARASPLPAAGAEAANGNGHLEPAHDQDAPLMRPPASQEECLSGLDFGPLPGRVSFEDGVTSQLRSAWHDLLAAFVLCDAAVLEGEEES